MSVYRGRLRDSLGFHVSVGDWSLQLREKLKWDVSTLESLWTAKFSGIFWKIQIVPISADKWDCRVFYKKSKNVMANTSFKRNMRSVLNWITHVATHRCEDLAVILSKAKESQSGFLNWFNTGDALFFYMPPSCHPRFKKEVQFKPQWAMDHKTYLLSEVTTSGMSKSKWHRQRVGAAETAAMENTEALRLLVKGLTARLWEEWATFAFAPRSFVNPNVAAAFHQTRAHLLQTTEAPLASRSNVALYRGVPSNDGSTLRMELVALSLRRPALIDARFEASDARRQSFDEVPDDFWETPAAKASDDDLDSAVLKELSYRFLVLPDSGSTPSSHLPRQLLSGTVLFREVSHIVEHWYFDLIPFVHYIPFETADDLEHMLSVAIGDVPTKQPMEAEVVATKPQPVEVLENEEEDKGEAETEAEMEDESEGGVEAAIGGVADGESLRRRLARVRSPTREQLDEALSCISFEAMRYISDFFSVARFEADTLAMTATYCNAYPQLCAQTGGGGDYEEYEPSKGFGQFQEVLASDSLLSAGRQAYYSERILHMAEDAVGGWQRRRLQQLAHDSMDNDADDKYAVLNKVLSRSQVGRCRLSSTRMRSTENALLATVASRIDMFVPEQRRERYAAQMAPFVDLWWKHGRNTSAVFSTDIQNSMAGVRKMPQPDSSWLPAIELEVDVDYESLSNLLLHFCVAGAVWVFVFFACCRKSRRNPLMRLLRTVIPDEDRDKVV